MAESNLLSVALPIVAGIVAWFANEWRKQDNEDRLRREERYKAMLQALAGFYEVRTNPSDARAHSAETAEKSAAKARFIEEVNLSWLYCPDAVVRAMYRFLLAVQGNGGNPDLAERRLVVTMRRDLWDRGWQRSTELTEQDFYRFDPQGH
ncbi:MAG: hypothetical protein HOQ30_08295 [Gemmatimonadaceae bacterium]|nr:hypothetical protein [Gemmatimonadaceae bacterium]NUQ92092.1 hypothetical protein [Gemmatimonadaceae bacterium]NUR33996.1 hypothetical protein [Gemmatimonadaceae bacterium]